EMAGLFDWEMTTVGEPLADLGVALGYWTEVDDPELLKTGLGKPPVTVKEGFYSRQEFIEEYAKRSGRDVSNIHFYHTFAYFRSEMAGLFDWEMTTVGEPLADLGVALGYWTEVDDPELLKTGLGKPPVTVKEGFYSRQEFIEEYAKRSGRDVSNIHFYHTFAYFKLAVICQQIYYRYKKGQTNDPRFAHFNQSVTNLIQHALNTAKGA